MLDLEPHIEPFNVPILEWAPVISSDNKSKRKITVRNSKARLGSSGAKDNMCFASNCLSESSAPGLARTAPAGISEVTPNLGLRESMILRLHIARLERSPNA